MNEDKFIQVNNLEKTYENGYQAIKSVSFSVKKGDLVCLLGPSGCGKTTNFKYDCWTIESDWWRHHCKW